jgi:hypothetical protein
MKHGEIPLVLANKWLGERKALRFVLTKTQQLFISVPFTMPPMKKRSPQSNAVHLHPEASPSYKILAPELPGQFLRKKSSIRSNVTATTHDSQSTISVADSSFTSFTRDEPNRSSDTTSREEDDRSSFFIPGITGRARCLESYPGDQRMTNKRQGSSLSPKKDNHSQQPSLRLRCDSSQISHDSTQSRGGSSSKSGNKSHASKRQQNPYDNLVDSIRTRHEGGFSLLDEEDFQSMMEELHKDIAQLHLYREDHSLRNQIISIRTLLKEYQEKRDSEKIRRDKKQHKERLATML